MSQAAAIQGAALPSVARGAAPGLVGLVTSDTTITRLATVCQKFALRELNKRRRVRRMRRVVIAAADAARELAEKGGTRCRAVFVTLTYAQDGQWSSRHISGYIKAVREWCSRRGVRCAYQWVIELTARGRPHYHLIFWLPQRFKLPKPDVSGQWRYGSSNIKLATKPVGYLVKYATKGGIEEHALPRGARLFGVGAGGSEEILHARHRYGLPMWLFAASEQWEKFARIPFVGWTERTTGEIKQTPFSVQFVKDDLGLVCVLVTSK